MQTFPKAHTSVCYVKDHALCFFFKDYILVLFSRFNCTMFVCGGRYQKAARQKSLSSGCGVLYIQNIVTLKQTYTNDLHIQHWLIPKSIYKMNEAYTLYW